MAPQRPHVPEKFPPAKITIISSISNIPIYKNESFLRQKYLEERLSISQISGLTFSARATILKYLRDYEIPIRPQDEAHKLNKGQLGYGQRQVIGVLVGHNPYPRIEERKNFLNQDSVVKARVPEFTH